MSDLIFKTNGEEYFCIPSPFSNNYYHLPKCPETKLEIKMTETDISKVLIEGEYATIMGVKYKRVEEPKTPVEEAYKEWWGQYPELETDSEYDDMRWQGFQAGYHLAYEEKVSEWEPTPQTPEQTEQGLKEAFREAVKQGIIPEINEPTDELIDKLTKKPPEFLKFELGKSLYDVIDDWWSDIFTTGWDDRTCINTLVDEISLWLPKHQSAAGSQSLGVEDMVSGFNDCLDKIRNKLR